MSEDVYGVEAIDLRENSIAVTLPYAFVDEKVVDKIDYKMLEQMVTNIGVGD